MLAVVDYGLGNLRSLMNAIEYLGGSADLVGDPDRLADYERIILPGVGAIADAMSTLQARGLDRALIDRAEAGVPMFGVCLGMQLLCTRSFEDGEHEALGLIDAEVVPFDQHLGVKVPHIGWNGIDPARDHPLVDGVAADSDVYFVHSYRVVCDRDEDVLATTEYGIRFVSMIGRENVMGAQFHPEKSQVPGLRILENFLAI